MTLHCSTRWILPVAVLAGLVSVGCDPACRAQPAAPEVRLRRDAGIQNAEPPLQTPRDGGPAAIEHSLVDAEVDPEADALVGRYRCARVLHPLVDFHRASLELLADGRFRLRHVNTSPEGGRSTLMEGPWRVERGVLVFSPARGRRRRWRGDEHRHQHGENVPYTQERVQLYQTERRVRVVRDGGGRVSLRINELGATLRRVADGEEPRPCADSRPRPF